jgi:hypothetical protein
VHTQKPQKIDLQVDYPCPCGSKGRIVPIILTEALGCNRCSRIFVVQAEGYALEELATIYSHKKVWHWTGDQWDRPYVRFQRRPSFIGVLILIILLVITLTVSWQTWPGIRSWIIFLSVCLFSMMIFWLIFRTFVA